MPQRPHGTVFVAAEEDDILGFAACGESRDVAGEGELYSIYALPEAWGTGAAPALMAAVRGALRASGFTTASLWVLEDNPRARRFYEREGWMSDGGRREEEFLEVPVAEIRYRIRLG